MCVAEMGDVPSLQVIQDLLSQYPHVPVRILQGEASIGVNPKINNMIAAYRAAQYNLIWISDISILTTPHTLSELVSHISPNHIALVHQLPFTTGVKSFADCLDKVYFGTQHSRVYLVANKANNPFLPSSFSFSLPLLRFSPSLPPSTNRYTLEHSTLGCT
jgi:ceramide glucosyltransferase